LLLVLVLGAHVGPKAKFIILTRVVTQLLNKKGAKTEKSVDR
jgi:hypothetical protein